MSDEVEQERRGLERYQLVFNPQLVDVESGEPMGYLVDISVEGLMLATDRDYNLEGRYRMRVPLPAPYDGYDALEVEGTAAWTRPTMNPSFQRTGFRELQLVSGPHQALDRLIEDYHLETS